MVQTTIPRRECGSTEHRTKEGVWQYRTPYQGGSVVVQDTVPKRECGSIEHRTKEGVW